MVVMKLIDLIDDYVMDVMYVGLSYGMMLCIDG